MSQINRVEPARRTSGVSLDRPPTLEEYRAWAETATRNATDDPIGARTAGRRETDKNNSAAVSAHLEPRPAERARVAGSVPQRPVAGRKPHAGNSVTPIREPQRKIKRLVEPRTDP